MTLSMSFIPAFMLPMCRSVEIVSGTNCSFIAGAAMRQAKLPPPCPTSKSTPRFRPSQSPGLTCPDASCSPRRPEYMCV